MVYRVLIDDNYHYMDESERITHGEFETLEAAIDACKKIVNDCLDHSYEPGMTAEKLYQSYTFFGEDPWILTVADPSASVSAKESATAGANPTASIAYAVPFSAWTYARQRCIEMCRGTHTS